MKKKKIFISLFFILIFFITFIISSRNIIIWKIESNKTKKLIHYSQELKDFNNLKTINTDIKGWLQVNGTNIDYPFVQAKDNKYYLTHSLDKSKNSAGWVFLDYRNDINNLSKNTIIYAHGRLDSIMFGTLKNILKDDWLKNSNNHIIKLASENENTLWQVFSVYHIETTNDYIKVGFNSNEEFLNWTKILINRSAYNFNIDINENDKILTLSTCYNDKEKLVLHARLIKKETR